MAGFRTTSLAAAGLLAAMGALPLAAQPSPGLSDAPGRGTTGAAVPDATVTKAGAALRDVMEIDRHYSSRAQAAQNAEQRQDLEEQAATEATEAIGRRGLSLSEYNEVIRLARVDANLRERLLAAARDAR